MNRGPQSVKQVMDDGRAATKGALGVNMNSGKSHTAPATRVWKKDMKVKTLILSTVALIGLTAGAVAAPVQVTPPLSDLSGAGFIRVAQSNLPNSGTVKEVIHAGNYTYLQVDKGDKLSWLAIPRQDVAVGAKIHFRDGMSMKPFHSDTLNRDFDEVFFLGDISVEGGTATSAAGQTAPAAAGQSAPAALPPGHAPVPGMSDSLPNAGVVKESIVAGNYTYLLVEDEGKETWLALPKREVPVGAQVRYVDGQPMKDFHSSSMDRTFDEVLFINGLEIVEN